MASAIVLTWIFMQRCPRDERPHLPLRARDSRASIGAA